MPDDEFSLRYSDLVIGSYDCVDRIVLNASFPLGHNPGGFRTWWRRWHGDSDAAASYEISGFTQDAIEFIEQLHLGPMHLVGHSLGGIVAQRVARARPDLVLSLALIATARSNSGRADLVSPKVL